jgi:hypothetical protein
MVRPSRRASPRTNLECVAALFSSEWPSTAWRPFQDALVAVVYERSGELWSRLRPTTARILKTFDDVVYEQEIDPRTAFREALPQLRVSEDDAAVLLAAHALVGGHCWEKLTRESYGSVQRDVETESPKDTRATSKGRRPKR